MSLSRIFAIRFGLNLLVPLALAVVVLFSSIGQSKDSYFRPAVVDSAVALVETHGCSDDVPDPTHAVVTVDGVTRYVGRRLTDKAIEQAVFGVDHGMTVHGFCA